MTDQPQSNVPNPFHSAKRESGVSVQLCPQDLLAAIAGMQIDAAKRLLDRHGGTVAAKMLGAGIDAAVEIARQEATKKGTKP
jgi:hypothetical protein